MASLAGYDARQDAYLDLGKLEDVLDALAKERSDMRR